MTEFVPLAVGTAMILTAMGFAKHLTNGEVRQALTLVFSVVVGVVVAALLRASDFAGGIDVAGVALADLNAASTVLFGFALASVARTTFEFKKAIDSSDSASESALIPKDV